MGSEGLNWDGNSLLPEGACVGGMRPGGLWGCLLLPPHTPTGLVTPVPVWHCWESWHGVGIRLGRESGHMECCAGLERDIFVTEFG